MQCPPPHSVPVSASLPATAPHTQCPFQRLSSAPFQCLLHCWPPSRVHGHHGVLTSPPVHARTAAAATVLVELGNRQRAAERAVEAAEAEAAAAERAAAADRRRRSGVGGGLFGVASAGKGGWADEFYRRNCG